MKIYLDLCAIKRPHDDQSDAWIQMETTAVESIIQLCRQGHHELITSAVLRFENSRNPNPRRKQAADNVLAIALHDVPHSPEVEQKAKSWQDAGVALLDSLHLGSADLANADWFGTCDDVLLRRAGRVNSSLKVVGVLELFKELVG